MRLIDALVFRPILMLSNRVGDLIYVNLFSLLHVGQ